MAPVRTVNWTTGSTSDELTSTISLGTVTVGRHIILCVTWQGDGTGSVTSPFTDNLGNSITLDKAQSNTSQDKVFQIWHGPVTNGGTSSIAVTNASGARAGFTAYASEYSGLSGVTDASPPGANGSSGNPDYGSLTPSQDNCLIICGAQGVGSPCTADTGFTIMLDSPFNGINNSNGVILEEIQTTATARNTMLTAPTSAGWAAAAVVFRAASAGTTPIVGKTIQGQYVDPISDFDFANAISLGAPSPGIIPFGHRTGQIFNPYYQEADYGWNNTSLQTRARIGSNPGYPRRSFISLAMPAVVAQLEIDQFPSVYGGSQSQRSIGGTPTPPSTGHKFIHKNVGVGVKIPGG